MKTVTAWLTKGTQPSVIVELPNVPDFTRLTPSIARAAARIAFGHTDGVTVMDGDNGYRLTRNSATKIETEPSF